MTHPFPCRFLIYTLSLATILLVTFPSTHVDAQSGNSGCFENEKRLGAKVTTVHLANRSQQPVSVWMPFNVGTCGDFPVGIAPQRHVVMEFMCDPGGSFNLEVVPREGEHTMLKVMCGYENKLEYR